MAGEGDFLHTAFAVVIAIDVDPAGGAALFYPGGDVQRMAGAAAGLKVDRRPGKLYIAALGAELNAFDDPTDREFQRQVVGFIARHGYHTEDFMVIGGRRGDKR